jgi:hypothetical protein
VLEENFFLKSNGNTGQKHNTKEELFSEAYQSKGFINLKIGK